MKTVHHITTVSVSAVYWSKFGTLLCRQFEHGGEK